MDVLRYILFLINVKFTVTFLRKLYMENPNNTNLLGFSNMLRLYGIDTQAGKITNKETFENEILPFLTRIDDAFVVVENCKGNKYKLYTDKETYIEKDVFFNKWDGSFLAFEKTQHSGEPQYENHRKEEKLQKFYSILGYGGLLTLCLLSVLTNENFFSTCINLLGCGIGGFLTYCIMAQHVGKNIAKKICTNSHHFDCNIEYRFGGTIDLADMCAAYFATFFLLTVLLKHSALFTTLFWASAIPVVVWSLWTQIFVVKKFCPICLCLLTDMLVLNVFNICTLDFRNVHFVNSDFKDVICSVLFFLVFLSFSSKYSKNILGKSVQIENIKRSNNYLKEQFLLLLNRFPQNIDSKPSCLDSINWGETNAQKCLVAVLNPTCIPCALDFLNMYRAMALSNSIKVHVFFTYWTKEQHEKLELLVSAILQNPNKMYVIQEWYDFGVYDQKLFKEKFCTKSIERKFIDQLIDRQKEWSVNNNIHSTPSFMLNGHFLPKGFNFMDIINF